MVSCRFSHHPIHWQYAPWECHQTWRHLEHVKRQNHRTFAGGLSSNPWSWLPDATPHTVDVLDPLSIPKSIIYFWFFHFSKLEFMIAWLLAGWWFGTVFIFPYIGNNHPNWLSYFSEGLKPPTRYIYIYSGWIKFGWLMCDLVSKQMSFE